jgi:hypothetical protein
MVKRFPAGMIAAVLTAMGLAFWAGRSSAPVKSSAENENSRISPRTAERSSPRKSANATNNRGAGAGAVTSALELREIFKHSGGNMQLGTARATASLAKMNAREISMLVEDLAIAQATTPGYKYTLEISSACQRWAEVDPDAALKFVLSNKQSSFRSAAIGSLFAGMAKTDPALARMKLASIDDPSLRATARSSMLSALLTDRPDEWVEIIKTDPSASRNYHLGSIASEWAMDDPVKAAARLQSLPFNLQAGAIASIAQVWAGKDSKAALQWANSLTDSSQRNNALGAIAGGIAASDPDAALASLDSLPSAARRVGLTAIFNTLLDLDYESALARANSLPDPDDQKAALKIIAGDQNGYSFGDPFGIGMYQSFDAGQLTSLLENLPPGAMRTNALNRLGNQLSNCTREEADAILANYPSKEREKLQYSMLENLAYQDPVRALEIYQSIPPAKVETYHLQNIISYLAQKDPEAALKLSLESTSTQQQQQGVAAAFAQFARADPDAAKQRIGTLPPGPMHDSALSAIASSWSQTDSTAALAWVNSLKGEEHTKAINAMIPVLASSNPKAAAGIISEMLSTSKEDNNSSISNAAHQLGQTWVREDPEAAGKWIAGLPDGNIKTNAIGSMMSAWTQDDFEGATKWIDTLPDGKARDTGVQSIVSATSNSDAPTAFEWANTISDDNQRENALSTVISYWKQNNANKARAAVNQADLSQKERERLLKQLE